MDALADDTVVLASSTSCIAASKFTEGHVALSNMRSSSAHSISLCSLKHRAQCIVAHPVCVGFFLCDHSIHLLVQVNPPHFIPLVELVPAPWTHPDVTQRTRDLMAAIGQVMTHAIEWHGPDTRAVAHHHQEGGQRLCAQQAAVRTAHGGLAPGRGDPSSRQSMRALRRFRMAWRRRRTWTRLCRRGWGCAGRSWAPSRPSISMRPMVPQARSITQSVTHPLVTGVADYCERYGENITAVCAEQCDSRPLKGSPTAQVIHDAMRKEVPLDQLNVCASAKYRCTCECHVDVIGTTQVA